jgi:hypothetical protein
MILYFFVNAVYLLSFGVIEEDKNYSFIHLTNILLTFLVYVSLCPMS